MDNYELPSCCALCDWHHHYHELLREYSTWQCALHGTVFKVWLDGIGIVMTSDKFTELLDKLSAGVRGEDR